MKKSMFNELQLFVLAFLSFIASASGGVNTSFGNCTTNGENFSYAPDSLIVANHWVYMTKLSSNDYARADWWPVVDVAPTDVPSNMMAHAIGWTKHPVDNSRQEISWIPTVPPQTNEWGHVIYVPVTNTVHFITWWIERNYDLILNPVLPPVPRKFSKLKIYGVISQMDAQNNGKTWDMIKAWLEAKEINGMNGWMAFTLAQELAEDNALFKPLAEEARVMLGLSQEQFDALLNACTLEE